MQLDKTNTVHHNIEFCRGFVECSMLYCEELLESFKSNLLLYAIEFEKVETPDGDFKIKILFVIKDCEKEDLNSVINLRKEDSLYTFKGKVEHAIEQIIETIREFKV